MTTIPKVFLTHKGVVIWHHYTNGIMLQYWFSVWPLSQKHAFFLYDIGIGDIQGELPECPCFEQPDSFNHWAWVDAVKLEMTRLIEEGHLKQDAAPLLVEDWRQKSASFSLGESYGHR